MDITLTVLQNNTLAPVLQAIAPMVPWGSPKGRYVASKASDHSLPPYEAHLAQERKLIERVSIKDEKGATIFTPLGPGKFHYEVQPELREEYEAELADMNTGTVVLRGARAITRAELGALPITVEQERVLVSVGLLEDAEPA